MWERTFPWCVREPVRVSMRVRVCAGRGEGNRQLPSDFLEFPVVFRSHVPNSKPEDLLRAGIPFADFLRKKTVSLHVSLTGREVGSYTQI